MSGHYHPKGKNFTTLYVGRYDPGYVYLIYTGVDYKIGKAKDVRKRMIKMKTAGVLTKGSYLVKTIHSDYPYDLERQFHDLFAHRHVTREFFALIQDEVDWIVNLPDELPYGLTDDTPVIPKY